MRKSRWRIITLSMSIFMHVCRGRDLKHSMCVAVKGRVLGLSKSSLRPQGKVLITSRSVESRGLTIQSLLEVDYKMDVKRSACKLRKLALDRTAAYQASIRRREVTILVAHSIH